MNFKKLSAGLLIALMSGGLSAGVAFADTVSNNVDATVDANVESLPLTVSGSNGTVILSVNPVNLDGKNGCNLTGDKTLTVSITSDHSEIATVSPNTATFTSCGDTVSLTVTPVTEGEATVSVAQTANDTGATFDLTTATFKAVVSGAAPVVILDTTPPTLHLPSDITGVEATSGSGAVVTYTATSDDITPDHPAVTCDMPSGSTFALGTTVVNCSATDAANNTATGSFSVTVEDTTAPTLPVHESPADNTFTTTALQQLINWSDSTDTVSAVTYRYESSHYPDLNGFGGFATTAYVSGPLAISEIPTPGSPEGVYYWHVRAVDAAGNASAWTDAWKITVDNTAPTISIATPTETSYSLNQAVNASYICSDALSGIATCVGTVAEGAAIDTSSLGVKSFTVTATDNSGNVTSAVVNYTVVGYNSFEIKNPLSMSLKDFKKASTIPVKFTIKNFDGSFAEGAMAHLMVNGVDATPSGKSNTGTLFRYDAAAHQYIYNLSTKSLDLGENYLDIDLGDGSQPIHKTFSIK
jgi:hypothetical protein